MNTYEPAFVGLAHLMPDWRRFGFPNEQAYLSAGSPKTQYAQWQKQQQAAPPPSAFPSTAERMGLTHPLPSYTPPPNAGQATASQELAEYGAPPAPKPDLSALYNPVAAAVGTSTVSPPQQFAGTFMQPNVTAPAGSLRAQAQATGAQDYTGVLTGLQRINEATAIPGVTPFLRNTVAPAVGSIGAAPGAALGIQPLEDVGRFLGESIVPATGLELGLEAIPGVGIAPDIARGARRLGSEATEAGLRRYAMGGTPEVVRAFDEGAQALPSTGRPYAANLYRSVPEGGDISRKGTGSFWSNDPRTRPEGVSEGFTTSQQQVSLRNPKVVSGNQPQYLRELADAGDQAAQRLRAEGVSSAGLEWWRRVDDYLATKAREAGHDGIIYDTGTLSPGVPRLEVHVIDEGPAGAIGARPPTAPPPTGAPAQAVPPVGPRVGVSEAQQPPLPGVGVAEGAVPPGQPPTGVAAITPPPTQPDPLTRLTDLIDQARPLPALTEAERKLERSRRVAAASSVLERGGYTGEAFRQAKGPLGGEYPRAAFEPVNPQFAPEEVQQLRDMIPAAKLRTFETINTNDALEKVLNGRLNEVIPSELQLLDRVYGSDFALAVAGKAAPPSLADKIHEFWLASILSGPITQLRNVFGNSASALMAIPERTIASALDPTVARLTGRETERFWQEVPEQVFGMVQGVPEGVRGALKAWKSGMSEAALLESARGAPAIGGLTGRIVRTPFTALEAMDNFFGAINFNGAMHSLAMRTAKQEGLKGPALTLRVADLIANPTDDLIEAATNEKLMRLFRDDPTRYGQAIMNLRREAPGVRFLVPFARTPDRLLAYGIKRSPLGLLDFPMWQRLVKGNAGAVDELSATLMGSSVALGLGAMVANGQLDITGAVPSTTAARDRFYREGKLPFSVKVPGVGWVQYNQIPGLDTALTTLASAKEAFDKGESIDRAVSTLGADIAASMFDRSYVSGLADFVEIFSSGGFEDPVDAGERWLGRQASGAVPFSGALRQGSQFVDQTIYQPKGIKEQVATGIGLGGVAGVPPRQTAFGQEATRPIPSPLAISPDRQTAVDQEIEALDTEIGPTGKSIAAIPLTRSQQAAFQRGAGQLTYQMLDAIIQSPSYQGLSDGDKIKVIERARDAARSAYSEPISKLKASEGWAQLTPEQQKQVIDAVLVRSPQELLQLMGGR